MLLFYNEDSDFMYLAWTENERLNVEMYGRAEAWLRSFFDGSSITSVEYFANQPHCIIPHSEPFYIEEEQ